MSTTSSCLTIAKPLAFQLELAVRFLVSTRTLSVGLPRRAHVNRAVIREHLRTEHASNINYLISTLASLCFCYASPSQYVAIPITRVKSFVSTLTPLPLMLCFSTRRLLNHVCRTSIISILGSDRSLMPCEPSGLLQYRVTSFAAECMRGRSACFFPERHRTRY